MKNTIKREPYRTALSVSDFYERLLCRLTLTAGHPEQHESHDEQQDEGADTHIGAAGELASHADDHGAEEGRALAADVEEAKVFARLFRRDDLCKVTRAV